MSILTEDFEIYPLGQTTPLASGGGTQGWYILSNRDQGGSVVVNPWAGGQAFQLGRLDSKPNTGCYTTISCTFDLFIPPGGIIPAGIFNCINCTPLTFIGPTVTLLGIGGDSILYVDCLSGNIGVASEALYFNTLYQIRLDLTFGAYVDVSVYVSIEAALYIDGVLQFDITFPSGVPLSVFPLGLGVNYFVFQSATFGSTIIDNINIEATIPAAPGASTSPAKVAQEIIEVGGSNPDLIGQIVQEQIEIPCYPPRVAQIAQEVIELVVVAAAAAPGGWKVYEA